MADGNERLVGETYDVFISYAHADTEADSDRSPAEALAALLEAEGYSVWWDRDLLLGKDWARELAVRVGFARKVIALVSPRWLASEWCRKEEFRAYETPDKLIPVIIEACDLPERLKALQRSNAPGGNFTLIKPLLTATLGAPMRGRTAEPPPADPDRVLLKLPSGTSRLFGRDHELSILDTAWTSTGAGKTNAVVFHAIGGAGKSALVRHFVDGLAAKGYPTAEKVYGWSAYSQGSGENRDTANAEGFIADALAFFGHDLATHPISDATERGRTLARLVRAKRTLIILDGLEPLQSQPLVDEGRLKDKGLARLITDLADQNPGLLVITSRQELPEIANRPLVVNKALDQLDPRAGAELLKHLGVHGRERELMDAVAEVGGHALSVNLLGTYLAHVCAGDITRRDTLRFSEIVEDLAEQDETARKARRAQRVMDAYTARFAELAAGGSKGKGVVELMLLRLIGLFNRPAEPGAIAAVLAAPPIPGLTDAWHALTKRQQDSQWGFALARLRKLRLLLSREAAEGSASDGLDAHPVVRQHFGAELQRAAPEAFREANLRLYRYFVALPEKELPDTLAEMEPLFHAIAHGCAAGLHQEMFVEVHWKRVMRGEKVYIYRQLGAFNADLGALAHFFAPPWGTPHPSLRGLYQASALDCAAFALRGLGRLRDALVPMAAAAMLHVEAKNWRNAATGYSNLSETRLTLGDVADAVGDGRQSITHADTSGHAFWREASRTTLADALHQAGDIVQAERLFREAEAMQAKRQPEFDKLYGASGYQFCDLLLGLGAAGEVLERADYALQVVLNGSRNLQDIAYNTLSRGRAAHALALHPLPAKMRGEGISTARSHLDDAVSGLRKAGSEIHIPRGLIARAAFRRDAFLAGAPEGDLAGAKADLDEAYEIAHRGGMRLHLTNIYLEWTRLLLAHMQSDRGPDLARQAEACWCAAQSLIAATGYHRRDAELAALRDALDQAARP